MNIENLLFKNSLKNTWRMFNCIKSNCYEFCGEWFFIYYDPNLTLVLWII